MIGDWVYDTHNRQNGRVQEIGSGMVMLNCNDLYEFDEIEPIPLTKEILEKNGFTDGKYRHFNGNVWELEADGFREIHLTEKVRQAVLWGEKINPDYPSSVGDKFTIPFIRYVHELQHAMKIIGIDKKFEL